MVMVLKWICGGFMCSCITYVRAGYDILHMSKFATHRLSGNLLRRNLQEENTGIDHSRALAFKI